MPRFVILRHETSPKAARPLHWDLMLEQEGVLMTWALPSGPEVGLHQVGQRLPDHRIAYLDFEGSLSGDRGSVTAWDSGDYERFVQDEIAQDGTTWKVELKGRRLNCFLSIEPIEGSEDTVRIRFERL